MSPVLWLMRVSAGRLIRMLLFFLISIINFKI